MYENICKLAKQFQSTPSVGRATNSLLPLLRCMIISIHALRGEGDTAKHGRALKTKTFQSTPSVGRATIYGGDHGGDH